MATSSPSDIVAPLPDPGPTTSSDNILTQHFSTLSSTIINPGFELFASAIHGLGLRATPDASPSAIAIKEIVLQEAPLLQFTSLDNTPPTLNWIIDSVKALSKSDRDKFDALVRRADVLKTDRWDCVRKPIPAQLGAEELDILAVWAGNVIAPDRTLLEAWSLFPTISRVNHSCTPNAVLRNNPTTGKAEVVIAVHDFQPLDEVTISYFSSNDESQMNGLLMPRKERGLRLETQFGFTSNCRCLCCSLPLAESKNSDNRRKEIFEFDLSCSMWLSKTVDPRIVVGKMEYVFEESKGVFAMEGLPECRLSASIVAMQIFISHSDWLHAVYFQRMASLYAEIVQGPAWLRTRDEFTLDPTKLSKWGTREKEKLILFGIWTEEPPRDERTREEYLARLFPDTGTSPEVDGLEKKKKQIATDDPGTESSVSKPKKKKKKPKKKKKATIEGMQEGHDDSSDVPFDDETFVNLDNSEAIFSPVAPSKLTGAEVNGAIPHDSPRETSSEATLCDQDFSSDQSSYKHGEQVKSRPLVEEKVRSTPDTAHVIPSDSTRLRHRHSNSDLPYDLIHELKTRSPASRGLGITIEDYESTEQRALPHLATEPPPDDGWSTSPHDETSQPPISSIFSDSPEPVSTAPEYAPTPTKGGVRVRFTNSDAEHSPRPSLPKSPYPLDVPLAPKLEQSQFQIQQEEASKAFFASLTETSETLHSEVPHPLHAPVQSSHQPVAPSPLRQEETPKTVWVPKFRRDGIDPTPTSSPPPKLQWGAKPLAHSGPPILHRAQSLPPPQSNFLLEQQQTHSLGRSSYQQNPRSSSQPQPQVANIPPVSLIHPPANGVAPPPPSQSSSRLPLQPTQLHLNSVLLQPPQPPAKAPAGHASPRVDPAPRAADSSAAKASGASGWIHPQPPTTSEGKSESQDVNQKRPDPPRQTLSYASITSPGDALRRTAIEHARKKSGNVPPSHSDSVTIEPQHQIIGSKPGLLRLPAREFEQAQPKIDVPRQQEPAAVSQPLLQPPPVVIQPPPPQIQHLHPQPPPQFFGPPIFPEQPFVEAPRPIEDPLAVISSGAGWLLNPTEQKMILSNLARIQTYPAGLPLSYPWSLTYAVPVSSPSREKSRSVSRDSYAMDRHEVFQATTVSQLCHSLKSLLAVLARSKANTNMKTSGTTFLPVVTAKPGTSFAFFRDGIEAAWEDPANKKGGRINLLPTPGQFDDVYLDLIYYLAGCSLEAFLAERAGPQVASEGRVVGVIATCRRPNAQRIECWIAGPTPDREPSKAFVRELENLLNSWEYSKEKFAYKRHFSH